MGSGGGGMSGPPFEAVLPAVGLVERAEAKEQFPPPQPVAGVHSKQPDGGASGGGLARDSGTVPREVLGPVIPTGMKQRSHRAGVRVNPREIGALLEIALRAGEREVGGVFSAAMLSGDDVFEVETEGGGVLRQATVFAAVAGSLADKFAGGAVHSGRLGVDEIGASLGLEDAEEGVGAHDGFEFGQLGGDQLAFGALARQFIVARLGLGVGLDPDQGARKFDRKTLRERPQEALEGGGLTVCHGERVARVGERRERFVRRVKGSVLTNDNGNRVGIAR